MKTKTSIPCFMNGEMIQFPHSFLCESIVEYLQFTDRVICRIKKKKRKKREGKRDAENCKVWRKLLRQRRTVS